MKKSIKNGLLTAFAVLLALCMFGCVREPEGGSDTVKEIYGGGSGNTISMCTVLHDGSVKTLYFYVEYDYKQNYYRIFWVEEFDKQIADDYFTFGKIDGISHNYEISIEGKKVSARDSSSNFKLTKSEALARLPSSGEIEVMIWNAMDITIGELWTIPEENADHVREWINNPRIPAQ